MHRRTQQVVMIAVCCLFLGVGCQDDNDNDQKSSNNILRSNLNAEANGDTNILLAADPTEIVIDTTDPTTPTDPGTGKFLGQAGIRATVGDIQGSPLVGAEVIFSTNAGTLASGGNPVITDDQGIATDTLTVLEDDPDSITVTATVGEAVMTVEITKTVILENTAPTAEAGMDQTVDCSAPGGTPVTLDGSGSSDPDSTPGTNDDIVLFEWLVDGMVIATGEVVQTTFDLGTTVVTLRVTDSQGLTGEDQVTINIIDQDPPTLTVSPSPDMLWPPNHMLRHISVGLLAEDACTAAPQIQLIDVTSDEPDNGTGDGDTENDIQDLDLGTADGKILLRAERAGSGDGRTYTLIYRVVDDAGNQNQGEAIVRVPHDRGR